MVGAILYKEWIKVYKVLLAFLVIIAYSVFDTFIDAKNTMEFYQATSAILSISHMGRFDFNLIDYILIIFAIALAVAQFYPEVTYARVRLFLHLPMSHFKLISVLIFSGLVLLALVFTFITFFYWVILNHFYPKEIFEAIFTKLFPIFLLSFLAYLTTMIAFLEPKNIKKVLYIAISFYILMIYSKLSQSAYFVNDELNFALFCIICIYILTSYEVFKSYTKGYIK